MISKEGKFVMPKIYGYEELKEFLIKEWNINDDVEDKLNEIDFWIKLDVKHVKTYFRLNKKDKKDDTSEFIDKEGSTLEFIYKKGLRKYKKTIFLCHEMDIYDNLAYILNFYCISRILFITPLWK